MSIYLGIDLGSTTTKAILLDEEERILGRGITNTRSDYHVATSVAKQEAEASARFTLLHRRAEADGVDPAALDALEDHFALEAFLFRIRRLREFAAEHVERLNGPHLDARRGAVDAIFSRIETDTAGNPEAGRRLRNSFFRDVVGMSFMSQAEAEGIRAGLDFEDLMGVFDVVILKEENTVLDLDFGTALKRSPALTQDGGAQARRLAEAVEEAARASFEPANMAGTGYGRQRLPFKKEQIRSEILCHGLGAHFMFAGTRTVLDIGGQDTKAIQVDENGIATNFQMNDRCAAGCGRYLGYVADELNISLDELGPLALKANRTVPVSSTCTGFAGAELRERLELGERREDILAGLHRAITLRAMSLLARSGGVREEFTFTGGVARNPAVVKELRALTEENYGSRTMNIHQDSIYMGALGAALYARRDIQTPDVVEEVAS
jgi:benzoyl-CoA reductase subunit A